nr:TM2 domain-containing protein [uncultured Mediterranean phage uvMED]
MIDLAIEQHMDDLPSKRARQHFLQQYSLRKRNAGAIVGFALLLGGLGIHRFYLRQTGLGIVYLLAGTIGWAIVIPPFVIGILCIVDACNSASLAGRCNHEIAREIMDEIAMLERCNDETLPLPPADS